MPLSAYNERFPQMVRFLCNAKGRQRIAHAYLLTGDSAGVIEDFAMQWVQVCACRSPSPEYDACGACNNCTRLARDTYPELFRLRPASKLRKIGVDDTRWLDHQLGRTASAGALKVGFICEADCMTPEAQNAFLKTLEEPVGETMLVLTSTRPRYLLPTIRSRCQHISLRENLYDYSGFAEQGLFDLMARLETGAGSYRGLTVAAGLTELFEGVKSQAETNVNSGEQDERWAYAAEGNEDLQEKLEKQKEAQMTAEYRRLRQEYLDALQTWFLQELLLSTGCDRNRLPQQEFMPYFESKKALPDTETAAQNLRLVNELIQDLSGNANEQLAIESFCLRICVPAG